MKVELSAVLTVLSIFAIVGGGLTWVLGKFLTDKKDKMQLAFRIERIEEMVHELKGDVKKLELIEDELHIIKEQIKHL